MRHQHVLDGAIALRRSSRTPQATHYRTPRHKTPALGTNSGAKAGVMMNVQVAIAPASYSAFSSSATLPMGRPTRLLTRMPVYLSILPLTRLPLRAQGLSAFSGVRSRIT